MENFIYNDNFYSDLTELVDRLEQDDELHQASEDETWQIELTSSEPLQKFDADWIVEKIDEERFTEDGIDRETERIKKALNECIDWDKLNSMIPKVHYPNNEKVMVTKQELLNSL